MSANKAGFYGTDTETYYRTPSGRTWIVSSSDDLGTQDPVEIEEMPETATSVDGLLTPEEITENLRRIERVSGEALISPVTTVEVDRSTAEKYFEEGGTVYFQPKGYSLGVFEEVNKRRYPSFRKALAIWIEEARGSAMFVIDPDHPYPPNPVRRSEADRNSFVIS